MRSPGRRDPLVILKNSDRVFETMGIGVLEKHQATGLGDEQVDMLALLTQGKCLGGSRPGIASDVRQHLADRITRICSDIDLAKGCNLLFSNFLV